MLFSYQLFLFGTTSMLRKVVNYMQAYEFLFFSWQVGRTQASAQVTYISYLACYRLLRRRRWRKTRGHKCSHDTVESIPFNDCFKCIESVTAHFLYADSYYPIIVTPTLVTTLLYFVFILRRLLEQYIEFIYKTTYAILESAIVQ